MDFAKKLDADCRRGGVRCTAGLFGKLHPNANFEEDEEDESQSNYPRNNK